MRQLARRRRQRIACAKSQFAGQGCPVAKLRLQDAAESNLHLRNARGRKHFANQPFDLLAKLPQHRPLGIHEPPEDHEHGQRGDEPAHDGRSASGAPSGANCSRNETSNSQAKSEGRERQPPSTTTAIANPSVRSAAGSISR